jgi:hypothetical protein
MHGARLILRARFAWRRPGFVMPGSDGAGMSAVSPAPRCCRCGSADSAAWFPLYRFRLTVCGTCYAGLLAGTAHLCQVFPVPA